MAARQEVRQKEAEAADFGTANRDTIAEPTRGIIPYCPRMSIAK